ncbi:energy transducer TonB [Fulvivirga sedimenti]|uniref:TonB family protein n=1 Tax=Fulvivirga sedimenti TaxID=2879465 RepID=A0A9X1HW93_9BACT|nr:energy transducer TonB [Fulvivirga sedimenti]MCA6077937.1 TonB family protein [Fulvivirga sedimenti]
MKSLLAGIFILCPLYGFCQGSVWLDKDLNQIDDSTNAEYFYNPDRVEQYSMGEDIVSVYYINYVSGQLYKTAGYKKKFRGTREGKEQTWDSAGQLISEGNYHDGSKVGLWKEWYADGSPKSEIEWVEEDHLIMQFYDSAGLHSVVDGDGLYYYNTKEITHNGQVKGGKKDQVWTGFEEGRKVYEESYEDGEFIHGKSFLEDGSEIRYTVLIKSTEYKAGKENLYDMIRRNMVYPEYSMSMGDQGKVYVEFTIDKDGTPQDLRVVRGISPELDKEALRVLGKMGMWNPALHRGIPVSQKVIIPIVFMLE